MRFFIEISYEGSNYHGWQVQPNTKTVQSELQGALSMMLSEDITIVGAGRTDSGVHAKQMFAHFDCVTTFQSKELINKLNKYLPQDISIHNLFHVNNDVNSRFDAISRTYC